MEKLFNFILLVRKSKERKKKKKERIEIVVKVKEHAQYAKTYIYIDSLDLRRWLQSFPFFIVDL
jgi:hypothetical protein